MRAPSRLSSPVFRFGHPEARHDLLELVEVLGSKERTEKLVEHLSTRRRIAKSR
jgi:hypothetical protein